MNRADKEKLILQGRKEQWGGMVFPDLSQLSDAEIDSLYGMYERDGTVLN